MQNRILALGALALALFVTTGPLVAAEQNRTYLIERFQNGDIPDGQDFADTIDSALNLVDDGLVVYRIGVDSTGKALRLTGSIGINETLPYTLVSSNPPMAPNWLGESGYLPVELTDGSGPGSLSYYGFFQISMDASDFSQTLGPAIHIEYLAWNDVAGEAITTHPLPEPGAFALVGCAAAMCLRRRRR